MENGRFAFFSPPLYPAPLGGLGETYYDHRRLIEKCVVTSY